MNTVTKISVIFAFLVLTGTINKANAATFTKCASEHGTCSFSGAREVRYGTSNTDSRYYFSKIATSSIGCNNSVFGDPVVGSGKTCWVSSETTTLPEYNTTSSLYTRCASENGTCSFSGTREVRYGTSNTDSRYYFSKIVTSSIGCNNSVFGDPVVGSGKTCWYANATTAAPSTTSNPDFSRCASENGTCSFSGTREVRYGTSNTDSRYYFSKIATSSIGCNNSVFGDPVVGSGKTCWYANATTIAREPTSVAPAPSTSTGIPNPSTISGLRVVGYIRAVSGQIIENVHVTTTSGNCIDLVNVSNVIIRNSEIGPCGVDGDRNTQGIAISGSTNIRIERNVIHDVSSAVYAMSSQHPIIIDRNYVYNIRGPMARGQMVQFNGVSGGTSATRITCNISDTKPGVRYGVEHDGVMYGVEDHISMFNSSGTTTDRIEIAYNRIRGGSNVSRSGSGSMLGDYSGTNINYHHNTLVNVANAGIGIAGGSNISVDNNRVYQNPNSGEYINIGIYVWGQGSTPGCGGGHTIRNNRVWTLNSNGIMNPYWNAGNCGSVEVSGNVFNDSSLNESIFNEPYDVCN